MNEVIKGATETGRGAGDFGPKYCGDFSVAMEKLVGSRACLFRVSRAVRMSNSPLDAPAVSPFHARAFAGP
jgi:hypothetical protein